jgi:hypothetical protein
MTEPARPDEPDPGPPERGSRKSDALSPGWADVRDLIITNSTAAALAVAGLARDPGSPAALEMAALTRAAFERAVEIARRWAVDEAVLSAERQRAYNLGVADCKAARCRLEVIDGGRGIPGPH